MENPNELTPAELAAKYINQTNCPVFLTGKAGTGKTTFLRKIIEHTLKNAIIVAPTGIAAINAGGVTIHSQFGLPFGAFVPDSTFQMTELNAKVNTPFTLIKHLNMREHKRRLLQELELLIIDEVSMLRADLLDMIDFVLKHIRRQQHKPFGGVQVLFIGDLMQLPPVVKEDEWHVLNRYYQSIYFFDALVLKRHKPVYIELDKIYRQSDTVFIDLLNHLRNNKVTQADIDLLNTYYKPNFDASKALNTITLTTHNYKADEMNKTALQQLSGKSFFYRAVVEDEFNESAYPVEYSLELKVGAQIMFVKNDPSGQQLFFNGKIAVVSKLTDETIEVDFKDGSKPIEINRYEWKNIKYELNTITNEVDEIEIGTFKQFPIKTAWAITVHKSQGLTFENAILDINRAFAPGQVYVALSRLKSLQGLVLTTPIQFQSIQQDKTLLNYVDDKPANSELQRNIRNERKLFLRDYLLKTYNYTWIDTQFSRHIESYQLDENKSNKQKHKLWAEQIHDIFKPLAQNAGKFSNQLMRLFESHEDDYLKQIAERHQAAKHYFYPILKDISKRILTQIELLKEEKQIKAYLEELLQLENLTYQRIVLLEKTSALLDAVLSGNDFNKQQIKLLTNQHERLALIKDTIVLTEKMAFEERRTKKKTTNAKPKKEKAPKKDTKEESYLLYKQGLSVHEIAKERKLTSQTVETHLLKYVSLGLIPVTQFVQIEKHQEILACAKKLKSKALSTLKSELGDDFSFSEIRFSLATQALISDDD